jgi:hypothetical protein
MIKNKILKELETKIAESLKILNAEYKTDSGRDTGQFARGYLNGLISARELIKSYEPEPILLEQQ